MNVSFVVMPFASAHRPAIGVSLLKAALKEIGISSDIHYFNLDFAELIGISLYDIIAEYELSFSSLIGELLFAGSSFNKEANDIKDQIEFELNKKFIDRPTYRNRIFQELMNTQGHIDNFISSCCSKVMSKRLDLIGFTSVFHQNCASISLAKKIKQQKDVPIIFGGANCEGEMGAALLKAAPWIDFICSGEGDIAFTEFVKSYIDKTNKKIQGIITRQSSVLDVSLTNPVMNMDNLPIPIFEDFFQAIIQNQFRHNLSYEIPIETSRGCWWGEKFQCTFCGLNGSTMKYRSKSIRRVLDELKYLIQRYGETKFTVVDNIMDLKYLERLFPEIHRTNIDVELFYETKSNLSKKQLSLMKDGGVSVIQPGIESLSDRILNIMKKGVSGLQNIALLKWCMEIGITPLWNMIWGFPGEPVDEYHKMARLVSLLVHLQPPQGAGEIDLQRFSPYFDNPEENGLINIRPASAYKFIYPLDEEDLFKIAYHFDFQYVDGRCPDHYVHELKENIIAWQDLWKKGEVPLLDVLYVRDMTTIIDTRPCSIHTLQTLTLEESIIYHFCETIQSLQSISFRMKEKSPMTKVEHINEIVTDLVRRNLMLEDNGRYLSLAVQVNEERLKNKLERKEVITIS